MIGDNGRAILLPGIATAASPVVFDDFLTARVAVFDDRLPDKTDGNGIAGVTFEIVGPPGQYGPVAYERVEANAAFCLFGGDEPLCPALDLNSARNQWPDGLYDATITIVAEADNLESVWFWQFCVRTCETTQVEDTQAEETVAPTATSAEAATVPPANELAARIAQVGPGSTYAAIGNALAFQVEAFDPAYGSRDGDGIEEVNLEIFGPDGGKVYGRTERNAAYCAFAGGEPDCNIFEFTVDDSRWPDTDNVVRAGPHRLFATVYAEDGRTATVEMTVQLE